MPCPTGDCEAEGNADGPTGGADVDGTEGAMGHGMDTKDKIVITVQQYIQHMDKGENRLVSEARAPAPASQPHTAAARPPACLFASAHVIAAADVRP